ncbi:hypothetical protein EI94DRAFT_1739172, partial [Lactarius quietus]
MWHPSSQTVSCLKSGGGVDTPLSWASGRTCGNGTGCSHLGTRAMGSERSPVCAQGPV